MEPKKTPMRMCAGCSARKPKSELIRVVRTPEGEIVIDVTGKKNGRGTYICKSEQCLTKAIKAKRFEHAFEQAVPDEVYQRLKEELEALNG